MTCLSHVRGACVHRNLHGTDGCQILPLNLWRHIKILISVVKWNSICGNISRYRNVALLCMAEVSILSCSLKQWSNIFSIAFKFKSCRTGKRTGKSFLWRASFFICALDDFIMSLVSDPAAQVSLPWFWHLQNSQPWRGSCCPLQEMYQKPQSMELTTFSAYHLAPLLGSLTPKYCIVKLENLRENIRFGCVTSFHPFSWM